MSDPREEFCEFVNVSEVCSQNINDMMKNDDPSFRTLQGSDEQLYQSKEELINGALFPPTSAKDEEKKDATEKKRADGVCLSNSDFDLNSYSPSDMRECSNKVKSTGPSHAVNSNEDEEKVIFELVWKDLCKPMQVTGEELEQFGEDLVNEDQKESKTPKADDDVAHTTYPVDAPQVPPQGSRGTSPTLSGHLDANVENTNTFVPTSLLCETPTCLSGNFDLSQPRVPVLEEIDETTTKSENDCISDQPTSMGVSGLTTHGESEASKPQEASEKLDVPQEISGDEEVIGVTVTSADATDLTTSDEGSATKPPRVLEKLILAHGIAELVAGFDDSTDATGTGVALDNFADELVTANAKDSKAPGADDDGLNTHGESDASKPQEASDVTQKISGDEELIGEYKNSAVATGTNCTPPLDECQSQKTLEEEGNFSNSQSCSKNKRNNSFLSEDDVLEQTHPNKKKKAAPEVEIDLKDGKQFKYNKIPTGNPEEDKQFQVQKLRKDIEINKNKKILDLTDENFKVKTENSNLQRRLVKVTAERDSLQQQLTNVPHKTDNIHHLTHVNEECDKLKQELADVTNEKDNEKKQVEHFKNQAELAKELSSVKKERKSLEQKDITLQIEEAQLTQQLEQLTTNKAVACQLVDVMSKRESLKQEYKKMQVREDDLRKKLECCEEQLGSDAFPISKQL